MYFIIGIIPLNRIKKEEAENQMKCVKEKNLRKTRIKRISREIE
jgi:hypothetical protein